MYVGRDAPNHYLKLTARENLRLFAGLHGGETEDPDALLDRVDLQRNSDKTIDRISGLNC